jgi:hypothetical protein
VFVKEFLRLKCRGGKDADSKEKLAMQTLVFLMTLYSSGLRGVTLRTIRFNSIKRSHDGSYVILIIDTKTSARHEKKIDSNVIPLLANWKRHVLLARKLKGKYGTKKKLFDMSDDDVMDEKVGGNEYVFTFTSYNAGWNRVKALKERHPVLKECSFTLHDTRRIGSR